MSRQTIEVIANDFGTIRIEADTGSGFGPDQMYIDGLNPGESIELTILAGTANPVEGGSP